MSTQLVPTPSLDVTELTVQAAALVPDDKIDRYELITDRLKTAHIDTADSFTQTEKLVTLIAADQKALVDFFEPSISFAHQLHKDLLAARNKPGKRLEACRKTANGEMNRWGQKLEAERQRHQRELDAAVRQEKEELEALASQNRARGRVAAARELQATADITIAAQIPEAKAATMFSTGRKNWKIRVTDKMALIKAVAAGTVPEEALEVNESWLRKQAIQRDGLKYPGVQAYQDTAFIPRR